MKKGRKVYKHQIVKVGILQISNNNLIPMNKHIRLFFFCYSTIPFAVHKMFVFSVYDFNCQFLTRESNSEYQNMKATI